MIIFWFQNADQSLQIRLELSKELTNARKVLLLFQTSGILTIYSSSYESGSCKRTYNIKCPTNRHDYKLQRLITFAQLFESIDIGKIKLRSWWISLGPPKVRPFSIIWLLKWFRLSLRHHLQRIILHRISELTRIFRLFIAKLLFTRFAPFFTARIHLTQPRFDISHTKFGLFVVVGSRRILEIFNVVFFHRALCFVV